MLKLTPPLTTVAPSGAAAPARGSDVAPLRSTADRSSDGVELITAPLKSGGCKHDTNRVSERGIHDRAGRPGLARQLDTRRAMEIRGKGDLRPSPLVS